MYLKRHPSILDTKFFLEFNVKEFNYLIDQLFNSVFTTNVLEYGELL